ncbi:MAG: hypothetical protein QOF60_1239 [Actinomycetota bacterium]|jgi:hypothetical protein|nr:hypothetical protein [Actinomycetota bacterium]
MAVMEIVTFRLSPGADEAGFLAADYRMQTEFVPHRPGFARRTTARADDGSWATVVLWSSAADAESAFADLEGDEVGAAFAVFVDPATLERRLFSLLD